MIQEYGKASFSKEVKFSNWETLMFLIFRWLGVSLPGVPHCLSWIIVTCFCNTGHISENLVFIMWWGPFCSLVHSTIMHRGPCCQSDQLHVPAMLAKSVDLTVISERKWKKSLPNEWKDDLVFVFLPLIGKKRKKNQHNWNLPLEFWGFSQTMLLFPFNDSTSLMTLFSSFRGVLMANGWGQQPSQAMGCTIISVS